MAGTTPIYGLPYPQSSDLVSAYPALGQDLAEDLDGILAAKANYPAGGTNGQALVKSGTDLAWATVGGLFRQIALGSTSTGSSTTSTSYVDTGLSATITPASASNKVLVLVMQNFYVSSGAAGAGMRLLRGSTAVWTPANLQMSQAPIEWMLTQFYLDQPSTTSAVTYKTQMCSQVSGQTVYAQDGNTESLMYLLEVVA